MEKRILIAFLLSFAVLYGARFILPPPPPPPDKTQTEAKEPVASPPVVEPSAVSGETIESDREEDKSVDTPHYRAVISNVGGVL